MRKTALFPITLFAAFGAALVFGQDITAWIKGQGGKPALAVTDFRGSGAAQTLMPAFNSTLFTDLETSALFDMKAKSFFPLNNPQRPEDLREEDNKQGFALADWSGAPTSASHIVFGYTAAQNNVLALYGYVFDARQAAASAPVLSQRYVGSLDAAGATKVAHEFAADIIQKFGGGASLLGSRIYFVSSRSGKDIKEIWAMDWDGTNQKQLTHLNNLSLYPSVSPDGSRVAFTTWANIYPRIMIASTETGRLMPFYNQQASLNASPTFTPDGKQIYYASSAAGGPTQIYVANLDGQGFRRVLHRDAICVEPKANPKNPSSLLFVSGPNGQQIYSMNAEGTNIDRVTNGEGEASNPSWNPDGQHIAFSWTRGYAKGDFNVFVMDIASRQYVQLTHSEGKNENPAWAPDGRHLVFTSTRSGRPQIYTMLADGSQVKQLTQQGVNQYPSWGTR
ncbi:MAG: translocation protein TolB [Terriglobia bacterium]